MEESLYEAKTSSPHDSDTPHVPVDSQTTATIIIIKYPNVSDSIFVNINGTTIRGK